MKILQFMFLEKSCTDVDEVSIPVSFGRSLTNLGQSVAKYGILHPILVRHCDTKLQIVSGQARWKVAQDRVPCLEIACDDEEAISIHIQENCSRGFNIVEIAKIVRMLQTKLGWSLGKISTNVSLLLGLPTGTKILQDYLGLLQLPHTVLSQLVQANIPIKTAQILISFSEKDAICLLDLAEKMRWNANKQREIFTWLWEICQRDSQSLSSVFSELNLDKILEKSSEKDIGQISEDVRQKIFIRKNPRFNQVSERFQRILKENPLPNSVTVQPSPNFEQNQINFQFSVSDIHNFRKILESLGKWEKNLNNLLEITQGSRCS